MRTTFFVTGYKFYVLQWGGQGLSTITKLSWVQEQVVKIVTNNLPLFSVLKGVIIYLSIKSFPFSSFKEIKSCLVLVAITPGTLFPFNM
jgi:hypothetical protein